jgi:hypothetical protein
MKTAKPINTKNQRTKLIKELLKIVEVVEFDPKTTKNLKGSK